jgi:DNA-binding transcriptional LysR family regulator
MDVAALRTVLAVAEAGSVTGAAARLHCVPSAVTARLRALEAELGQPLFVRRPRGMAPTPAGEVLLGYARSAVRLMEEAARAVAPEAEPRGTLRVGATDTTATVHLPAVFARYHEAHPQVALALRSAITSDLLAEVRAHRLDCAIVNTVPREPVFRCDRIRTERLVLATARAMTDPFARSPATMLAARAGGAQRARVEAWWREAGGPPTDVIELPSIGLRLSFAAAGIGVAALPASALEVLGVRRSLRIHAIPEPWCLQDVALVARADAAPFAAMAAFRAMLLDLYGAA